MPSRRRRPSSVYADTIILNGTAVGSRGLALSAAAFSPARHAHAVKVPSSCWATHASQPVVLGDP
jgi:hypothetical protein